MYFIYILEIFFNSHKSPPQCLTGFGYPNKIQKLRFPHEKNTPLDIFLDFQIFLGKKLRFFWVIQQLSGITGWGFICQVCFILCSFTFMAPLCMLCVFYLIQIFLNFFLSFLRFISRFLRFLLRDFIPHSNYKYIQSEYCGTFDLIVHFIWLQLMVDLVLSTTSLTKALHLLLKQ